MTPHDRYYEIAHFEARLAGEEGEDHPRQTAVRWLVHNQRHAGIAKFNEDYETKHEGNDPSRVYCALLTAYDASTATAWWRREHSGTAAAYATRRSPT